MTYGPNTSDTRANPPLAMFVEDIARWFQNFSGRIWNQALPNQKAFSDRIWNQALPNQKAG